MEENILTQLTISEMFEQAVSSFGNRTAVVFQDDQYSWNDLDVLSDIVARRIASRGIKHGDRVGIWSVNSPGWIVTFIALQKIGAVTALLNVNYQKRELSQVLRIGDIRWLCYGNTPTLDADAHLVYDAVRAAGLSPDCILDIRDETLTLKKMLFEAKRAKYAAYEGKYSDLSCILFTTGTTSDPKCVLHDHLSMVNNAIATAERAQMTKYDRLCLSQPLFHMFPICSTILAAFHSGMALCISPGFRSKDILKCVEDCRCTILNGVPTNFICLYTNPILKEYRTDSLRLSIIGGAAISAHQLDAIRQAFPTVRILRNYGLTEGCNLCNNLYDDGDSLITRTVGPAYPGIEIGICDEDGNLLPPGQKGEIVTRGYNVMLGYYSSNRKAVPKSPIDENGWLHTGDLGIRDEKGYLTIVGRIKDIIIRGGENVSPGEIRGEILRYEPILDTMVVGAPHPVMGEQIIACMTLDEPEDYSEQELRSMLHYRIARFKMPEAFYIYDEFPLKPNGKVDMVALKEDVRFRVEQMNVKKCNCNNEV